MADPVVDFLDKNFFRQIVSAKFSENHKISKILVENVTGKGEGYLGVIYRGILTIRDDRDKSEELDLIIKVSAGDKNLAASIAEPFRAYEREIQVYSEILPKLQNYLDIKNVKLAPMCYKTLQEPYEIIVLENLKNQGFQLGQKNGFDFATSKMAIEHMAKFHAASAKYVEDFGSFSEFLCSTGMYSKFIEEIPWGKYVDSMFLTFRRMVREIPELQREADKLDKFGASLLPHITAVTAANLDGFKVLNHGDLWNFNIFFKYNNGEPVDVVFVR